MEPKKREVTGKLKECIENITPESIAKTKANMELEKRQFGYFKIIIPYLTIVWDSYWHQIVVGYGKYEISKYSRGCIFWKRLFGIFKPHHI